MDSPGTAPGSAEFDCSSRYVCFRCTAPTQIDGWFRLVASVGFACGASKLLNLAAASSCTCTVPATRALTGTMDHAVRR